MCCTSCSTSSSCGGSSRGANIINHNITAVSHCYLIYLWYKKYEKSCMYESS